MVWSANNTMIKNTSL